VRRAFRAIALTGLIVGAMDITSAVIIVLSRGSTVTRLLQFIASGLLGPKAFQGGPATAFLGLALHFLIAFTLVAVFYAASRSVGFMRQHAVSSGIIYGLVVYAVMNLLVLPLSAAKPRHSLTGDLIQIGIHMFIIGLPTSLLLRRLSGATA
jgi:Na+/pantothenate symporter